MIAWFLMSTIVLLVLYILIMRIKRLRDLGELSRGARIAAYPVVIIGVVLDALYHYTWASLLFLDLPARGEHLLTARLKRYVATDDGWRCALATWMCARLLNPFDPSGRHC